jgi:hypothetical protein
MVEEEKINTNMTLEEMEQEEIVHDAEEMEFHVTEEPKIVEPNEVADVEEEKES